MRRSARRWILLLALVALFGAACGGDGADDDGPSAAATGEADAGADSGAVAEPASGSEPAGGGELVVGRADPIDGWNPDNAVSQATYQTLPMVYDTLIRFTPDGAGLAPGLAEEWTLDLEGLTYTFTLRDGLQFSDGTPLTSADVAFSVDVWKSGPALGILYGAIDTVGTPDDRTVVFNLGYPDSVLPAVLTWASSAIMPADFGGQDTEDYFRAPVGAGPFVIDSWSPGNEIVLSKNPNYWGAADGLPKVDKVTFRVITDLNQRILAFQAGDVQIIETLPLDALPQVGDDEVVLVSPSAFVTGIVPNHAVAPLDDVNVRRAISLAIDRAGILAGIYGGRGSVAEGMWPLGVRNSVPGSLTWDYDLTGAQEALAASAGAGGFTAEIIVDSGRGIDGLLAEVLQSQLAEIGIDLEIAKLDTGTWLDRLFGGDFELAISFWAAVSPDVGDPMGFMLGTGYLASGADVASLEEAFFALSASNDDAERDAIVAALQDDHAENIPMIPIVHSDAAFAVSGVGGFEVAPFGLYYTDQLTVG